MDPEPEDLNAWVVAGFARGEAASWRRWRFTIERARAWISAGVTNGLSAAQWTIAGVTPKSVAQWRDGGISPDDAVRWHEFGIGLGEAAEYRALGTPPDQVWAERAREQDGLPRGEATRKFHDAGVSGEILSSYVLRQWLDDEAADWAEQGIGAAEARAWQELGLTPAEGGELARAGREPMSVISAWWRAGIPFDEVADWLGAGLTPEEASRQRASGVTVEQAAAVRAKRRPSDEDDSHT